MFLFILPENTEDDDDELFLWYGLLTIGIQFYNFSRGLLSGILTIVNLQHVRSKILTCAEPESRFS